MSEPSPLAVGCGTVMGSLTSPELAMMDLLEPLVCDVSEIDGR
jgi:hypothetical protein